MNGWLAEVTLTASGVLGLVWLIDRLARRRLTAARRHWLWCLGLTAVLAAALGEGLVPEIPLLPAPARPVTATAEGLAPTPAQKADLHAAGDTDPPAPRSPLAKDHLIATLWAVGACLFLLRHAVQTASLRRLLARSATPPPRLRDAFAETSRRVGVQARLRVSGEVPMPIAFGLLRPVIVLPRAADRWPAEQTEAVLLHELAHVARRDALSNHLSILAGIVCWHHPLIWLARWRLSRLREMACDDRVLAAGCTDVSYAAHLLEVLRSVPRPPAPVLSMADGGDLERRLRAILDPRRPRHPTAPAWRLATALGLAALALPIAALSPSTRPAAAPPPTAFLECEPCSFDELAAATRSTAHELRLAAAEALASSDDDGAVDLLLPLLADSERRVRLAATRALGARGERRSFYQLIPYHHDPDPEMRAEVVQALGGIGCEPAFIAVAHALTDASPAVRRSAARTLATFPDHLVEVSLATLAAKQAPSSRAALDAVLGPPRSATARQLLLGLPQEQRATGS